MTLDRMHGWLERSGADAVCITQPVSIGYLTGFHTDPHERLMALVIREGSATLVVPELERESAETHARETVVVSWRDGTDAVAALAAVLGNVPRLAVEKSHLNVALAEELSLRAGVKQMLDAGAAVARLRLIKTDDELRLLAEAAAATDRVVAAALEAIAVGRSELEIAAAADAATSDAGGTPAFDPAVQSGPNSALPHLKPTSRRVQAGDLVLLDLGASRARYRGDITRMAVAGEPDRRQRELHSLVLEAHDRAIDAIREGVPAREVDAAARRVISGAGMGDRFIHRVGHGLGLEAHEDPSLTGTSDVVLEAGMVVTIEPGVYFPGWGGIRIEDDVVVERDGARVLTHAPHELRVVG